MKTGNHKKLALLLETHFCDLEDTAKHETELKKQVKNYFNEQSIEAAVKTYTALSDEKRIKIMLLLRFREMCNCELTAALDVTQPNLTYHVKKLENAGMIKHRRDGKYIYYSLVDGLTAGKLIDNLHYN